ncbi:class E sortase [Cellulomonas hominis]
MTAVAETVEGTVGGVAAEEQPAPARPAPGSARPPRPPSPRRRVRPRRPTPAPRPLPDGALVAVAALTVLAVIGAWLALQLVVLAGLSQSRAQQDLYDELRTSLAAQTAPTGGAIDPGTPVALLTIPTLGVQQVVVEGTASTDLTAGPGHRRDTPLPGQRGVSLVYGRPLTYGGPFRTITTLQEGDGIEVTTAQGRYVYRVDGVRRTGDPMPARPAQDGARLTLVTAEGSGGLSAWLPDHVVYVDATLQDDAAVAPTGRPVGVPDQETAMGVDTSDLALLAVALQGLLVAVVAIVLVRGRVPGRALWVMAVPVLMALAWFATDQLATMLPNLL